MTAVIREKTWAEGTTASPTRKPESWIKVMGRLTDSKKRARIALNYEKDYGRPMSDPDGMTMYVAFSVDHLGIEAAMEKANQWVKDNEAMYGSTFEFQLSGGRW